MGTPADQRLLDLLDKWLKSLDLHLKYASLDTDSYWQVQPWMEHERPSRWIIELARQKTIALRTQIEERVKMGDVKFSDALELMAFLANLVGSEHIERFIPLADPAAQRTPVAPTPGAASSVASLISPAAASVASHAAVSVASAAMVTGTSSATASVDAPSTTGTLEMPNFGAGARSSPPAAGTAQVARAERSKSGSAAPAPQRAGSNAPRLAVPDDVRDLVIADAARLMQWGRKWFELAELIARMADRPTMPEVRRILHENKAAIDAKAARSP